jgi:hypothetical protein
MEDLFEEIDDEIFLKVDVEKTSTKEFQEHDSFDDIIEDDDLLLLKAACECEIPGENLEISMTQIPDCDGSKNIRKRKLPPVKEDKNQKAKSREQYPPSKRIHSTKDSEIKFSLDDDLFSLIQTPPDTTKSTESKMVHKS